MPAADGTMIHHPDLHDNTLRQACQHGTRRYSLRYLSGHPAAMDRQMAATTRNGPMAFTTGILIFDDVEELDFVGPWEVLSLARHEGDRVVTISEREGPVRAKLGLRVLPDHNFENAPELDVLVVPGGQGTRREVGNPELVRWIATVARNCEWVSSVCTGALLLHSAGLLGGRRATTHWGWIERFREATEVEVVEDERFVVDGRVVTSAGISAGIDMALWLVGQLYDPDHARYVQRRMEYDPAPPYSWTDR